MDSGLLILAPQEVFPPPDLPSGLFSYWFLLTIPALGHSLHTQGLGALLGLSSSNPSTFLCAGEHTVSTDALDNVWSLPRPALALL